MDNVVTQRWTVGRQAATLLLLAMFPIATLAASPASCIAVTRNLGIGMRGDDVLALQRFLNSRPTTHIAESGPGSPGNETLYFGSLTQRAVVKYQEEYLETILRPVGLARGSGYVGANTRAVIATQCEDAKSASQKQQAATSTSNVPKVKLFPLPPEAVITPKVVSSTTPAASSDFSTTSPLMGMGTPMFRDILHLVQPSSYMVKIGQTLRVIGGGYSKNGNVVHIGNTEIFGLVPDSSGDLVVTVPADTNYGKNDLWVSNENGSTLKQFVVVVHDGAVPPKIATITPSSGVLGTTITITGDNFTANNEICFAGTPIIAPSSDGKTIVFQTRSNIPGAIAGVDVPNGDVTYPAWFYIVNENGVSNSTTFYIKA